ncbi:hypothetical protein B0H14DRAFT_2659336 [Mycena olivaceomarginata]|nr:hypothetical protein B0H14DRAFT_2659336 [Mycena olivaceomarginata]
MASTIATRRNASTSKKPSIYKNVVETLQRENSGSLAMYDFGETFHRKFDASNAFGKYYLGKGPDPDSQPRLFNLQHGFFVFLSLKKQTGWAKKSGRAFFGFSTFSA